MKIKNLEIENFKCFGQKQSLDFGRITLLTGANSSGKSSLMYAILACLQSNSFPFMLSLNGDYVNMGDFKDTVFRNDVSKKIFAKIAIEIYGFDNITITSNWQSDKHLQPKLYDLVIDIDKVLKIVVQYIQKKYEYKISTNNLLINDAFKEYILSTLQYAVIKNPNNIFTSDEKHTLNQDVSDFLNNKKSEIIAIFDNINDILRKQHSTNDQNIIQGLSSFLLSSTQNAKNNINFAGAFRLSPQRGYLEKTQIVPKLSVSGEGYLDQILAWETEKSEKFKYLKAIMKYLALTHDIKSKRQKGGKFEVLVKTKSNSVFSSLTDVGFGISNFLPIIVADLQLDNDSTLFVSQPETHLHPSVQSKFGEYLSSQITQTNKNYVVETHSEYLLNNIRLAIVKGEVKSEDVKIYYIEPDGTDRKIHHISFAKNGQILNAPKSFFDTYMIDVMNIALNATAE